MWTDALTPLRWLLRGSALLLVLAAVLLPTVVCQGRWASRLHIGEAGLDEWMLRTWSGALCRVFGVKPLHAGRVAPGPVLVVANHISWLDIMLLHSVAAMGFVAKAEIEGWPVFGFLARRGGTIFHRRGSHDSATGVMHAMLARLQEGGRVAVFPEGGILPGEQVSRFHARMFAVAVEAGCPVQPVMLRYLRGGRRDHEVTFIRGESFLGNALRLLGRPACTGEVRVFEPFSAAGVPRRELAERAFERVSAAYESPVQGA